MHTCRQRQRQRERETKWVKKRQTQWYRVQCISVSRFNWIAHLWQLYCHLWSSCTDKDTWALTWARKSKRQRTTETRSLSLSLCTLAHTVFVQRVCVCLSLCSNRLVRQQWTSVNAVNCGKSGMRSWGNSKHQSTVVICITGLIVEKGETVRAG